MQPTVDVAGSERSMLWAVDLTVVSGEAAGAEMGRERAVAAVPLREARLAVVPPQAKEVAEKAAWWVGLASLEAAEVAA